MKIAITGANGFIGSHLKKAYPDHVVIGRSDSIDVISEKIKGCHALINLAGAPIIKRWTPAYKKVLWESRIGTTRKVVEALNRTPVPMFFSTSAVGIYPDDTDCDEACSETSKDFLGELAEAWEAEAMKAQCPTAIIRFGMVLGPGGGALAKMLPPFKLGIGGRIGDGKMVVSWIHIRDLVGIYEFLYKKGAVGIFNAVTPNPVTNAEFTKALATAVRRPAVLPVPVFALRLLYGDAYKVLTGSKRVFPRRLIEMGFRFKFPSIKEALMDIVRQQP